ncbi:MAG: SurA N-terminal domain-containing protein [Nitrospiraceae bacterium]|nr:SurA N-terminal domain-containing protein [Nitrospiraceae bacterium]
MKKFVLFLAILVLASSFSCAKSKNEAKSADNSPVLARVGDKAITKAMFDDELNALPPQIRDYFLKQGGSQAFLNEIINKELLYQEAVKEGIDNDQRLQKAVEDYKKITMVKLLLHKKIESSPTVSDAEVQKYYDDHKNDFKMKGPGKTAKVVPFDTIKPLLRQRMIAAKQEQAFSDYVNTLKKTTKVDIDEQAVKALNEAAPAMGNTPVEK